jgi:hypothetical protein
MSKRTKPAVHPGAPFWISLLPTAVSLILLVSLAVAASQALEQTLSPYIFIGMLLLTSYFAVSALFLTPRGKKLTASILSLEYLIMVSVIWLIFGEII